METLRKVNSPQYDYLQKKTQNLNTCETTHPQGEMCGNCFWQGITIPPECISECRTCKEDTEKFGRLVKDNPRANSYSFEPDCFKACMWWEWFHSNRKMKCGCNCKDVCVCGKIKYGEKKKVVVKRAEEEDRKKKTKK